MQSVINFPTFRQPVYFSFPSLFFFPASLSVPLDIELSIFKGNAGNFSRHHAYHFPNESLGKFDKPDRTRRPNPLRPLLHPRGTGVANEHATFKLSFPNLPRVQKRTDASKEEKKKKRKKKRKRKEAEIITRMYGLYGVPTYKHVINIEMEFANFPGPRGSHAGLQRASEIIFLQLAGSSL